MKQQINLYLPEFRIKKDPLTALLMGQIVVGLVAVMVLISAFDLVTRWGLNRELAGLQEVLTEETRKTAELEDVLARRSENSALTARLEAAESRLQASRQIRDFLGQSQLGNVQGFSEYFKDLSRAAIEGLSISEFSFSNGGASVMLSGQVVDSAMVPRYVNRLEQGQSPLRLKQFSPAISRDSADAQFFSFVLSTASE